MTPTEQRFLRQLRDLLRFHGVKLVDQDAPNYHAPDYRADWTFQGPEIELTIETVAEELEQP